MGTMDEGATGSVNLFIHLATDRCAALRSIPGRRWRSGLADGSMGAALDALPAADNTAVVTCCGTVGMG